MCGVPPCEPHLSQTTSTANISSRVLLRTHCSFTQHSVQLKYNQDLSIIIGFLLLVVGLSMSSDFVSALLKSRLRTAIKFDDPSQAAVVALTTTATTRKLFIRHCCLQRVPPPGAGLIIWCHNHRPLVRLGGSKRVVSRSTQHHVKCGKRVLKRSIDDGNLVRVSKCRCGYSVIYRTLSNNLDLSLMECNALSHQTGHVNAVMTFVVANCLPSADQSSSVCWVTNRSLITLIHYSLSVLRCFGNDSMGRAWQARRSHHESRGCT